MEIKHINLQQLTYLLNILFIAKRYYDTRCEASARKEKKNDQKFCNDYFQFNYQFAYFSLYREI